MCVDNARVSLPLNGYIKVASAHTTKRLWKSHSRSLSRSRPEEGAEWFGPSATLRAALRLVRLRAPRRILAQGSVTEVQRRYGQKWSRIGLYVLSGNETKRGHSSPTLRLHSVRPFDCAWFGPSATLRAALRVVRLRLIRLRSPRRTTTHHIAVDIRVKTSQPVPIFYI